MFFKKKKIAHFYIAILKIARISQTLLKAQVLTSWHDFFLNWDNLVPTERPTGFKRCVSFKQKAENYFALDLLAHAPTGDWDDDY